MPKLTLLAFLLSSLVVGRASAFTLNNSVAAAFPQENIQVNVASHTCVNIGISNQELLAIAVEASNNFWNRTPSSRINLVPGSIVAVSDKFRTDAICSGSGTNSCTPNPDLVVASDILISCNVDTSGNNFSSGVLGITVSNNISGRDIKGALILLNDKTGTSLASRTRDEWIAIIAHEIGHAIGLGHSPVRDSLMFFTLVPKRTYLGEDDMDGVTYLYPAEQPMSGGCGSLDLNSAGGSGGSGPISFLVGLMIIALVTQILKSSFGRKTSAT
jgi:hypothetical protein